MVLAASGAQDAVVGDVAQQGVLEEELAGRVERGELALEDEVARRAGGRRARGVRRIAVRRQVGDGVVPEDPADDRGPLQRGAFRRRQGVEPGLQQALERRGHDEAADQLVDDPPPRRVGDDDARRR